MTGPESWRRARNPELFAAGDVGGDWQVSEAWGARWTRSADGGLTAMVTRYFYVVDVPGEGRRIEQQIEYLLCRDADDPGSTEVWSDGAYEPGVSVRGVTSPRALDAAARWAAVGASPPTVQEAARFRSWPGSAPVVARASSAIRNTQ